MRQTKGVRPEIVALSVTTYDCKAHKHAFFRAPDVVITGAIGTAAISGEGKLLETCVCMTRGLRRDNEVVGCNLHWTKVCVQSPASP